MKTRWRVHRSREVADYLIRLREAGRGIRQIISFLAQYGVPPNADIDKTVLPHTHTWTAAGHIITCIVAEEEKAIYVAAVEPMEPKNTE